MRPKLPNSFEDLIASYYGSEDERSRGPATVEELFTGYYGKLPIRLRSKQREARPVVQSLSCDDGASLLQKRKVQRRAQAAPIGLSRSRSLDLDSRSTAAETLPNTDVSASRELEVDFAPPEIATPVPRRPNVPESSTVGAPQAGPEATVQPVAPPQESPASPGRSQDELADDLKAILGGQKVFDPRTKSMVDKSELNEPRTGQPAIPPRPLPANDGQAIFDRIAQSMEHANAFDLGTVELQNRFSDFDRFASIKRNAEERKLLKQREEPPLGAAPERRGSSVEFIEDLGAIRGHETSGTSQTQSVSPHLSEALYDTGEHVITGADLYPNAFHVGKAPGVMFSYGQIIAMADLFESVHQMLAADPDELNRLKALIERSTAHAQSKAAPDVTTEDWNKATNFRYTKLAEDNYDHFAPNVLFPAGKSPSKHGNHKQAWDHHHRWAIAEAQKLFLESSQAGQSSFPEWPLLVNAFGDHFLTDAFASGHVINKEAVIDKFKSTFYARGALTDAAKQFFHRVAERAFHGEVQEKFKKLETAKPYDAWWNIIRWNPNITSADRFAQVLIGAAEQEPDKIANMAVKAIHDWLNKNGVEVTNRAGSGTWHLTGDGYLTPTTLDVMRRAVRQSAANIVDPGLFASNPPIDNYIEKVWSFVPTLTPSSVTKVKDLVVRFVSPSSADLVQAATEIIAREVDLLIKVLIDKGALQEA